MLSKDSRVSLFSSSYLKRLRKIKRTVSSVKYYVYSKGSYIGLFFTLYNRIGFSKKRKKLCPLDTYILTLKEIFSLQGKSGYRNHRSYHRPYFLYECKSRMDPHIFSVWGRDVYNSGYLIYSKVQIGLSDRPFWSYLDLNIEITFCFDFALLPNLVFNYPPTVNF